MKIIAVLISISLALAGTPFSSAASHARADLRLDSWKSVGVVDGANEFAGLMLRREDYLPVDHLERADIAIQTAGFLRENEGPFAVQWNDAQRRLRLIPAGKETSYFEAAARAPQVVALSERLLGKSREDAESALREYFDEAARVAAAARGGVDERSGDAFRSNLKISAPGSDRRTDPPAPHPIVAFAPNLVTGLNLASGLGALFYAAHGAIMPAAGLILLANVFDALDGRVARMLGVSSPIGTELDSLADVVPFGAAPAMLIYQAALGSMGAAGFALAAAFAFAGAYRLARFNLQALSPKPADKSSDSFTGMPIPAGAGVLVSAVLALSLLPAAAAPWLAAPVTAIAALAMVSTIPYPAFKKGGIRALIVPAALALTAAILLLWLGLAALIPAAVFGGYLFSGPIRRLLIRS